MSVGFQKNTYFSLRNQSSPVYSVFFPWRRRHFQNVIDMMEEVSSSISSSSTSSFTSSFNEEGQTIKGMAISFQHHSLFWLVPLLKEIQTKE